MSVFLHCPLVSQERHHLGGLLLGLWYTKHKTSSGRARSVLGISVKANKLPNDSFPFPFAQVQSLIDAREAEPERPAEENKDV